MMHAAATIKMYEIALKYFEMQRQGVNINLVVSPTAVIKKKRAPCMNHAKQEIEDWSIIHDPRGQCKDREKKRATLYILSTIKTKNVF